ncbi:signal peptidase I [Kineosporia sp. A_224]|uniref:signal peptidase I n=1 Tax=Kineosporia sp. A_224 TaxID=1962180 RepID=UPI0018E98CB9|nr:signal peptidase I [Kineosporia sp. A_224]
MGRPRLTLAVRAAAVLVAALLVRAFVAHPDVVESTSMTPTLHPGDVVLVVRPSLAGLLDGLDRGDLVVAREPGTGDAVVKRVVGLPGDVVEIADAVTTVGGVAVDEPYVDRTRIDGLYYGPVTVPAGTVLLMGDDRSRSVDSRDYGPVPLSDVTDRVAVRLWPWTR